MKSIDKVLEERGARYGEFPKHAEISQTLKTIIFCYKGRDNFADDQIEAIEMVCHKLARILNGDADYADSWTDIAGYAKLVADRLLDE